MPSSLFPIARVKLLFVALLLLSTPVLAETRQFLLVLEAGRIVKGDETLRVTQGDQVSLTIESNQALELHLHGYDLEIMVAPDSPGLLELDATLGGRFPVEAHGGGDDHGHVLFYLEVYPD